MTDQDLLRASVDLKVLVAGDICLDRWCRYEPALSLPSAETGIPRIAVTHVDSTPGAGGTVANNLASLGVGWVSVLGVIGDDGYGFELRKALAARGIRHHLLVEAPGRSTFTYTKLLNNSTSVEDQPRVDFVPLPSGEANRQALAAFMAAVDEHDIILIADQAETETGGVIGEAFRVALSELAPVYPDKLFLADSRRRAHLFRHICLKPNRREGEAACQTLYGRFDGARLREDTAAPILFVTDGPNPIRVYHQGGEAFVPVMAVDDPVDICGAGDSFAAGAALALFLTGDPVRAAEFGSRVARITIGKPGTGTAAPAEVLDAAKASA